MKKRHIAILFFLISLLTVSCSKLDSLFNNGEPITEQRNPNGRFKVISMYNNVNVKLVQSDHPKIELTCPKNLIEKVTTEVIGDTLFIRNENDYNWLRSFDYDIDMTVYFNDLRAIYFASNGNLLCTDSIRGIEELAIDTTEMGLDTSWVRTLNLYINEGSGNIDLTISSDVVKTLFRNGTSEVVLRGIASYTEIIMRSYGVVHAEALCSNFVRVQSNSTNDAYVYAKTKLTAWLYSIGNVYYKGHPWIVQECPSDGRVIKLE